MVLNIDIVRVIMAESLDGISTALLLLLVISCFCLLFNQLRVTALERRVRTSYTWDRVCNSWRRRLAFLGVGTS